jgi:hypothetical protein
MPKLNDMKLRWLKLDDGLSRQPELAGRYRLDVHDMLDWGGRIRLACSLGRFRRFEKELADRLAADDVPYCTLYGSGDFHHVSLALLRRVMEPFNLLALDWMRGVPLMHCGTWLYHAARLGAVQRIFRAGGNVDFDNGYRFLAPVGLLRSGKIVIFPALRTYQAGLWTAIPQRKLRPDPATPLVQERLRDLLQDFAAELAQFPLYISLDKDVLRRASTRTRRGHGTRRATRRAGSSQHFRMTPTRTPRMRTFLVESTIIAFILPLAGSRRTWSFSL